MNVVIVLPGYYLISQTTALLFIMFTLALIVAVIVLAVFNK